MNRKIEKKTDRKSNEEVRIQFQCWKGKEGRLYILNEKNGWSEKERNNDNKIVHKGFAFWGRGNNRGGRGSVAGARPGFG